MHELSITENIVKICCEEAVKHGVNKVLEIRLEVGELSGLIPESIQFYFDIVSRGTEVEGAKLVINKAAPTIICLKCGNKRKVLRNTEKVCEACGSGDFKILRGNEFLIQSLEVE